MSAPQALIADPERAFLENFALIERILSIIARRHSLSKADAQEFGAWAKARLVQNDYAIFRKFAGRSTLSTYLTVVLTNSLRDYRNSVWGRWRPSAAAVRLGPIGIRLEELLYRDDHTLREAIAVLHSAGCELTDGDLARLAVKIPPRQHPTEVGLEKVDEAAVGIEATTPTSSDTAAVIEALRAVVQQLPPDERVITRMRFWDDVSVADIARALGLEQKPLYRKLESIQDRLRKWLEARGIDRERAAEILTGETIW
jgi:RNA polymerase sigma factor for flagellar operon FliA